MAEPLAGPLMSLGLGADAAESLVVIVITLLLITYVALVVSELTPRRYAMQRAEGVAMLLGPLLDRLATVFRPVIWVLSKSTNGALRLLRADPTAFRDEISGAELRELVMTHEGLPARERTIVREVFAAGDRHVREAMLPRTDIDFLDASSPVSTAARTAWEHAHTRYPVTDGSTDKVIGFVHVRDLLDPALAGRPALVRELARGIIAFLGTKPLLAALGELQAAGAHMAVVVERVPRPGGDRHRREPRRGTGRGHLRRVRRAPDRDPAGRPGARRDRRPDQPRRISPAHRSAAAQGVLRHGRRPGDHPPRACARRW